MFYDIFSDLCKSIGKSPTGVALELNIQRGTVSNWKNNGAVPNPDALKKIAEYFDVTVDDLLDDDTNCDFRYSPTFWKTFMSLCIENRETPAKVCHNIGVSEAAATKWKKGEAPSVNVAQKIANYFNVDIDCLLEEDVLNKNSNEFYDTFLQLCNKKGVKPTPVTQAIGISKTSATKWKKGAIPNGDTLQRIAEYFNVSIDCLLGKEKMQSSIDESQEDYELKYYLETFKNRKEMRELFRVADKTTAENIKKAIEIMEILNR